MAVGDVSNEPRPPRPARARRASSAVVFHELLGWDPGARRAASCEWADTALAALEGAQPGTACGCASPPTRRTRSRPRSSPSLVARGGPAAIHLAESAAESPFPRGAATATGRGSWRGAGLGHVPFRPARAEPGALPRRPGRPARRAWWPRTASTSTRADRERLARAGVHVALCPRSNRNLGVGRGSRAGRCSAAGVHLCLGTDSLASVDTPRPARRRGPAARQFPDLDPAVIVSMATAGGARGARPRRSWARSRRACARRWPSRPRTRRPRDPGGLPRLRRGAARGGSSVTLAVGRAVTYGRMIKLLALGVRPAVRAVRGAPWPRGGGISARTRWSGSWWRWWGRAARPWASTAWPTSELDARNPRTAGRELPRGRAVARARCGRSSSSSAAALVVAAAMLNPLCLALSPVALAIVFGYSYTKRFTRLSHLVPGPGPGHRARWARGSPSAARFAWPPVVLGPRRPALGGRLRHHLRLPGRRLRPRARACTRCPRGWACRRALAAARGAPRRARSRCWRALLRPGPAPSRCTWSGWRRWPACSPTSTRSCARRPLAGRRGLLHRERLDQRRLLRLHAGRAAGLA